MADTDQNIVDLRWKQYRPKERVWSREIPVGLVVSSGLIFLTVYRDGLGPNQACTLFGSEGGSTTISGTSYLSKGFGYEVADLWRLDFTVLVGFFLLFQATQILALEYYPVSGNSPCLSLLY